MSDVMRGSASCPAEEELAAYLSGVSSTARQLAIDAHLAACDACLRAVMAAARRTSFDREILLPVPEPVLVRAAAAATQAPTTQPASGERSGQERRPVLRSPLPPARWWLSAALAASLAWVAVQTGWLQNVPEIAHRQTRAVRTEEEVKISARRAEVLAAPHPRAAVVATLARGDTVRVGEQDRDWYRVTLPDGREGWIAMEALR